MLSKRLIIIFSVLLGIVLIVVLMCTLFNLNSVKIVLSNDMAELIFEEEKEEMERKLLEKYKGNNLLFTSTNKMQDEFAKISPYILYAEFERVFPTSIVVHLYAREELFAIKLKDSDKDKYFIYDTYGILLRKSEDGFEDNNLNKKMNIQITGIADSEVLNKTEGQRIELQNAVKTEAALGIFDTLMSFAEPNRYTASEIKDFIKEIDVNTVQAINITTRNENNSGVVIRLCDKTDRIAGQMQVAVAAYAALADFDKTKGELIILPDASTNAGFSAVYQPLKKQ